MKASHDPSLDTLVDLDGQVLVVDPVGGHWVRFVDAGTGVIGKGAWTRLLADVGRGNECTLINLYKPRLDRTDIVRELRD